MEEKLIELEKRVSELELINKKMKRNRTITSIITIIFIITVALLYIFLISKVFNIYTDLF